MKDAAPNTIKIRALALLTALILSPAALWGDAERSSPFGAYGLDLTAMDKTVKPGDDFYKYAEGHWLATTKIPGDRSRWGAFDELALKSETDVREILEQASAKATARNTADENEQKIGDYYAAFLDTERIESLGLKPAEPGLQAIAAAKSHDDIGALMAKPGWLLDGPIAYSVYLDAKNPDRYVIAVGQSGLSLPDRDYYLKPDPEFVKIRQQFAVHVGKMLELAGHPGDQARKGRGRTRSRDCHREAPLGDREAP